MLATVIDRKRREKLEKPTIMSSKSNSIKYMPVFVPVPDACQNPKPRATSDPAQHQ